jgi:DNA polymerase-3 subunit gamma/tau
MQDNVYNIIRPTGFEDIFEYGEHIKTVKKMLREKSLPHTIMITGPTGYGKSTLADIIAKGVNCVSKVNPCNDCDQCNNMEDYVTWVHAGDERGIEQMRRIAQEAQLKPLSAQYGVTLIDEAGGLTTDAQRTLREIAENPPSHRYIILITSEREKIKQDLQNRCFKLDIPAMTDIEAIEYCEYVCKRLHLKLGIERTLTEEEIKKIIDFPNRNCRDIVNRIYTFIETGIIADEEDDTPSSVVQIYNNLLYRKKDWFKFQEDIKNLDTSYNETKAFLCNLASKTMVVSQEQDLIVRASQILEIMLPPIELATQKADMNYRFFAAWRKTYTKGVTK